MRILFEIIVCPLLASLQSIHFLKKTRKYFSSSVLFFSILCSLLNSHNLGPPWGGNRYPPSTSSPRPGAPPGPPGSAPWSGGGGDARGPYGPPGYSGPPPPGSTWSPAGPRGGPPRPGYRPPGPPQAGIPRQVRACNSFVKRKIL